MWGRAEIPIQIRPHYGLRLQLAVGLAVVTLRDAINFVGINGRIGAEAGIWSGAEAASIGSFFGSNMGLGITTMSLSGEH